MAKNATMFLLIGFLVAMAATFAAIFAGGRPALDAIGWLANLAVISTGSALAVGSIAGLFHEQKLKSMMILGLASFIGGAMLSSVLVVTAATDVANIRRDAVVVSGISQSTFARFADGHDGRISHKHLESILEQDGHAQFKEAQIDLNERNVGAIAGDGFESLKPSVDKTVQSLEAIKQEVEKARLSDEDRRELQALSASMQYIKVARGQRVLNGELSCSYDELADFRTSFDSRYHRWFWLSDWIAQHLLPPAE